MRDLERYRDLVDDPQAFLEAAARPLPRVAWANPLRVAPGDAEAYVAERCPGAERVPWVANTWRLPPEAAPGKWPEFALGLVHVQEEVALRPVEVLAPTKGEAILDLCAAPGNKTAHIAAATADGARLVANDIDGRRLRPLQDNLTRLGVTSAVVTRGGGAEIGGEARFDRVLVDAPCTGEGTTRKAPARRGGDRAPPEPGAEDESREKMRALQKGLLRRAVALTRPGGRIVYSTCTYAPEENEGVVSGVDPERAVIEPFPAVPGLHAEAAVPAWGGERYRDDVVHAARYWPHHNDTGGFFVAQLRRL